MGAWGFSYGDANFNPDVDLNNDDPMGLITSTRP
jgi:hypothetical protein